MSNLRDQARAIKVQGEKNRGHFEPRGVPLRMWTYWRDNAKGGREFRYSTKRENFCHFWRVVAIWAPLLFIKTKAIAFFTHPLVVGVIVIAALVAAGLALVAATTWMEVLIGIGVVASAAAFVAAIFGLMLLIEKYVGPHWKSSWTPKVFTTVLGLAVLAIWTASIIATFDGEWLPFVIFIGIPAVLAAMVGIAVVGNNWLEARSDLRREREQKERESWTEEQWEAYFNRHKSAPREPGRIAKFFSGIGDFLVLIGQVVRVNKWKICPIVDINK